MRIPTLEAPAPDEMFTAWIAHLAKLNHMSANEFYRVYFRINRTGSDSPRLDYPMNLEYICNMEKDSAVFPKLEIILRKHTDLYMSLPFMPEGIQAKYFEFCLRHPYRKGNISNTRPVFREYKVCPLCVQEDKIQYKRMIMHVPHQVPNVNACWKHHVKLQNLSDYNESTLEQADEIEWKCAAFMQGLYETPVLTNYELVRKGLQEKLDERGMIFSEACQNATNDGYLTQNDVTDLSMEYQAWRGRRHVILLNLLVWLYQTSMNFRKDISQYEYSFCGNDEFEFIRMDTPLVEVKCRCCSAIFHIHPIAIAIGTPCPECMEKMTENNIFDRYLEKYGDGEYEFVDEQRTKIRHNKCGTISESHLASRFWKKNNCLKCQTKDILDWQNHIDAEMNEFRVLDIIRESGKKPCLKIEHIGHNHSFYLSTPSYYKPSFHCYVCEKKESTLKRERIGMKNVDRDGKWMEIISYRSVYDIDVRYEDGIVKTMPFIAFLEGRVSRKNRIGMRAKNRQGLDMEIIGQRTAKDLDVQFADGTIVKSEYRKFLRGTVYNPNCNEKVLPKRISVVNDKGRLGEERINTKGFMMKIVAYRKAIDIDVQFEDGTMVFHTKYDSFAKGFIKKPE